MHFLPPEIMFLPPEMHFLSPEISFLPPEMHFWWPEIHFWQQENISCHKKLSMAWALADLTMLHYVRQVLCILVKTLREHGEATKSL
jgi:hypothetical protein